MTHECRTALGTLAAFGRPRRLRDRSSSSWLMFQKGTRTASVVQMRSASRRSPPSGGHFLLAVLQMRRPVYHARVAADLSIVGSTWRHAAESQAQGEDEIRDGARA